MSTIITSVFKTKRGNYEDLFRVFDYSARKFMPEAEIKVIRKMTIPKGRNQNYSAMTARLESWVPVVNKTKGNIILCDVDLIFRADLFKVFDDYDFDVAYTNRNSKSKPLNGGIIFIRDGAQVFVKTWAEVNRKLYSDIALHQRWRKKCRGMNQPSLYYLIKNPEKHGLKIIGLPCSIYNACNQEWATMPEDVQVIHLKKALRYVINGKAKLPAGADRAIAIWREMEREATCEK